MSHDSVFVLKYKTHFKPLGDTQIMKTTHSTTDREIVYCKALSADLRGFKVNEGSNPLSNSDKVLLNHSFATLRYKVITRDILEVYFGSVKGLSLVYTFRIMQSILAYPYRHITFISNIVSGQSDRAILRKNIEWLIKEGYVSIVMRPRKLMMLNSYTMDKTYLVNKKGKRVMQLVYEAVGLM